MLVQFFVVDAINQIQLLRVGVAHCCGVPPVCFAWHAEGPGIKPGLMRDNIFENFSGFGPFHSSSLRHLPRVGVNLEVREFLASFIFDHLRTHTSHVLLRDSKLC